jgi:insulysin
MQSPKHNVLIDLLNQLAYEPSYDQLRTKEQLGYVVGTGVRRARGTQGFQILVQGDRHPAYVETRIDNFLNDLGVVFQNMTEDQFLKKRQSFSDQKAHKVKSLSERNGILWSEISLEQYNFKRQEMEIQQLENITLTDFVNFYERYIGSSSNQRRRMTVHIISMADSGAGKTATVKDIPVYENPRVCNFKCCICKFDKFAIKCVGFFSRRRLQL